jgi:nitrogen fixation protein NifU and related proteins
MTTVSALYQSTVLEHNRAPRRFGALPAHTHAADGENARCGDRLRCELVLEGDRIAALRFAGEPCAIATAAASMLGECAEGTSRAAFERLHESFRAMLASGGDDAALGELAALAELRNFPARQQCALLPFATLAAALGSNDGKDA